MKISAAARNAQLDTLTTLLDGGFLKIYQGVQPSTPESAPIGTLLSTLSLGSPAFGAASAGSAVANPITGDTDAASTGIPTWFRCLKSDAATAVIDGTIGTSLTEIILNLSTIHQHDHVSISSFAISI